MAQPRPLHVQVLPGSDGAATVVQVVGDLDFTSIDKLRAALLPLVAKGKVVLDAAGVTFCDSAGLHAILQAHRDARAHRTTFRIAAPSDPLTRVIELAGALPLLAVFPDTRAALAD